AYAAQFPSVGWAAPYAISGPEHLQQLLAAGRFSVIGERNDVALLERGVEGFPLADRYIRAAAPPGAQLVVDVLRDVTVSVP
ncbi:MAG: hypothetical protein Q7S02_03395, partial [bacterium]|nr:hypothetical protein [bacterium]